ncbi:hypothetical protein N7448_007704 [Penicillium atrosanguineum]|nr:hypothetical protein N7448_007704 [Penicillium atrosanguineum]KAJ5147132.1 hypothetical protein N7526_000484 [Penicillium atrosanguineum]
MDWRNGLGFTDRLRVIQSLTTAYQQASSASAFTEAQTQARRYETEAYENAVSKEEYDGICQQAIDAAETTSVAPVTSTDELQDAPQESEASDVPVGEKFGQYSSCFHHFDGLHSTIYKAKAADGTVRAVKITIPHLMTAPHDAQREARLLREAHGPHTVSLIETFRLDGGRLVLVFPFLRYDLEHLFRRDMVTATQTRSILRDLFQALAHIHKTGIIHRDIKPSNILMDSPRWTRKITDVGTTCYRPPEILFGDKSYGTALDLWAAGCVVAEAIGVGHRALFDSGPVGSDLSLIVSIFKTLGTPNEQKWPGAQGLPDWGKVQFYDFPAQVWDDILPGASSNGRDLARQLLCYESSERLTAEEALGHPYFSTC